MIEILFSIGHLHGTKAINMFTLEHSMTCLLCVLTTNDLGYPI